MREKISISIDKNLIKKINQIIDRKYIKNRSQAFEVLLKKALGEEQITSAIILGGGSNSKALFRKVAGKTLVEHQIEKIKQLGIKNIFIAAYENRNKIFDLIGGNNDLGLRVSFLKEERPLGTAGAVKLAEKYINSTFLVLCGDVFFDFDLNEIIRFHKEKNALATIALTVVEKRISNDNIELSGNFIKSFIYASRTKSFLTNAGIYVFEPEIFKILPQKGFLETDVFPKLIKNNKIIGFVFSGKWQHMR
jgi:mannose-1-phosphate guanylyltransferase